MKFRQITPFLILMFLIAMMFQVGCDTLITENNTITLIDTTLAIGCFNCHNDEDNLLLRPKNQFDNSAHANFAMLDTLRDIDGKCGDKCHTHEGFLVFDSTTSSLTSYRGTNTINCYTCHLPHTGDYGTWDGDDLRAINVHGDSSVTLSNTLGAIFGKSNLCGHCHSANQGVPTGSSVILDKDFGPHYSPQADIASGKNGYFLPVDTANYRTGKHFDNGCIKCHYGAYGEGQGYTYAEHTFRLEDTLAQQQFAGTCNNGACHNVNPPEIIDFYDTPKIHIIDTLAKELKGYLASYDIIDTTDDKSGRTFTIGDEIPKIQAEAYYNYLLYLNDGSRGIHNMEFVTDLLDTTIKIMDSLPPVTFFVSLDSLDCFDSLITFTPMIRGDFDSLYWNFGNDSSAITTDNSSITTIYSNPGTYNVELTSVSLWGDSLIIDSVGDTTGIGYRGASRNTLTKQVIIDDAPIADFTMDTDTAGVCIGDVVTFTSTSTHLLPVNSIFWDYGDGDTATVLEGSHSYNSAGTYSPSLIVSTNCGADTLIKVDSVIVHPNPVALFTSTTDTDSLVYVFNSTTSTGAVSWKWEFFTGTVADLTSVGTSIAENPTFTFTELDVSKSAKLEIINVRGCSDSTTEFIYVYIPPAN